MRSIALLAAAGLCLAFMPAAEGRESVARLPKPPAPSTCGDHGTNVEFMASRAEAAKKAQKEEKLVFVLHVSGHFEDPGITWNNAEALRVNALADPEVGKYLNEHFVSAFQKVGTFKIVNGQKQGGNVASYFCAQDGRVLHVIPGPVNGPTMLREAKWVVENARKALDESKKTGTQFKVLFRQYHADRLRQEHGLVVEPVTFDPNAQDTNSALTYKDPTGRPLAPVLPPPPIEGPDVSFQLKQQAEVRAAGAVAVCDKGGRRWQLGNQGRAHQLLAAHALTKIEVVYGSVFEGILGERVSTKPVEVNTPFPWVKNNNR